MLLVGVFLGEPSLRSTPASTSRISNAIYSRNHVPVFELNLNAPCDNPVTREDLETIRKLVDLVPPFVERYMRMSELLRAVSGFGELAAYVRRHIEAVQRNQINGKLRHSIRGALASLITRYLHFCSQSHGELFEGVAEGIAYLEVYVKVPHFEPILCNTKLQQENLQSDKREEVAETHFTRMFNLACLLQSFQHAVIAGLEQLERN